MRTAKVAALLVSLALVLNCSPSCTQPKRVTALNPAIGGPIAQETLEMAWKKAIEVFGGGKSWKLPFTPDRVILVPSALQIGDSRYFGITTYQPDLIGGRVVLVEVIEIHLRPRESCYIYQVLVHEFGHTILTRRLLTDPNFARDMKRYRDEESMIRALWPPSPEMMEPVFVCPE